MRLKKGSKVEVLGGEGVPSGSWIPAEIISGNGHHYSIRYDRQLPAVGAGIVAKVPRKLIRPPPPPVQPSGDWELADIVEMFDQDVWKPAEVSELAGEGYFGVKLAGSFETSKVPRSNLRARQVWKNNQWRVMGKESVLEAEKNVNGQGPDFEQRVMEGRNDHPLKRKMHVTSQYSVKNMSALGQLPRDCLMKKGRAAHDGPQWALPEDDFLGLPEKVVAISSPKRKLGGKGVFNSHPKRRKRLAMESDKRISSASFPRRNLDYDKAGCDELSACSSSGSNSMNMMFPRSSAGSHPDIDEQSDDANSCTGITIERQSTTPAREGLSAEIHQLELHAYRSTLGAFYASGPMSWEQESLISNLRLVLHISDDEHLFELRSLASRESNVVCY